MASQNHQIVLTLHNNQKCNLLLSRVPTETLHKKLAVFKKRVIIFGFSLTSGAHSIHTLGWSIRPNVCALSIPGEEVDMYRKDFNYSNFQETQIPIQGEGSDFFINTFNSERGRIKLILWTKVCLLRRLGNNVLFNVLFWWSYPT